MIRRMLSQRFGKRWLLAVTAATMVALLVACGSGTGSDSPAGTTGNQAPGSGGQTAVSGQPVEPANKADLARLRGDIVIDGSSTVYPVTAAAAEEFRAYARDVRISVGISGTGGGFKRFCVGETDIQDASRPILAEEVATCRQNNVDYIELPVAYDGLTVVVNPQNTWASCLTVAELKKMWEPAAQGTVTNWNQIRPSFPNQPLKLFGAGTDSGTYDYFTEAITGKSKSSRGDFQASEDDNVLVQGVSGDPNALGFFGLAYYEENKSKLKAVQIDNKGDGKCVAPSFQSVADASYQPLSRPIFIYVKKSVASRPEVQGFVKYYLSKSFTPNIQSREVGYVTLSDQLYEAITKRFDAGTTGTLFPNGQEIGATLDRYLK